MAGHLPHHPGAIAPGAALQAIVDGVGTALRAQFTTITTLQEGTIN